MNLKLFELKLLSLLSICLIQCFLLQSCKSDNLTAEEKVAIVKEIEKSVDNYLEALADLDTLEMRRFYYDSNDFLMSMDGTIIKGNEEVQNVLKNLAKNFSKMFDINKNNVNISILSKESAVFTMEFKWTAVTFENDTLKRKGTATYALKKVHNDWKAVHFIGLHIPDENVKQDEFRNLLLISN